MSALQIGISRILMEDFQIARLAFQLVAIAFFVFILAASYRRL